MSKPKETLTPKEIVNLIEEKMAQVSAQVHLSVAPAQVFQRQVDATLTQAAPVQNTWYTILDTTPNVRVYIIAVRVETADETLECRITIDGDVIVGTVAATAGDYYFVYFNLDADDALVVANPTTDSMFGFRYSFMEARSIKVEVRKTTALGAGNLLGNVKYAKIP